MKWRKPKMNWTPKRNHTGNTETIYDVRKREHEWSKMIDNVKPLEIVARDDSKKPSKKKKEK